MSTTQRSSDLMGARILVVGGLDADAALLTAALTPAGCALAFTADLLAAREMAVFFTDIRNFTALSESMTPHENFRFLNSFLSHVTPVIRANGGFIDKYIGDAVMALFPRAPGDALAAAVELLRRMGPYNAGRRRAGYEPIRIGIGAHHGPLILGTIGEAERMQTTVISDTVNVAARLEGLTKTFGVDLLVSGSILDGRAQPERFHLRHLGAVKAKGKTASVEVYECFDLDPPELIAHKLQTAPLFAQALAEFGRGTFLTAGRLFQRVAAANPSDGPAAHYRDRCSLFAVRGTGVEKWDGADLIETK